MIFNRDGVPVSSLVVTEELSKTKFPIEYKKRLKKEDLDGKFLEISLICSDQKYRIKNIAKGLLECLFRSSGKGIILFVAKPEQNMNAIGFYKFLGMRAVINTNNMFVYDPKETKTFETEI